MNPCLFCGQIRTLMVIGPKPTICICGDCVVLSLTLMEEEDGFDLQAAREHRARVDREHPWLETEMPTDYGKLRRLYRTKQPPK